MLRPLTLYRAYKNANTNKLASLVNGRSVCLVGNAQSLLDHSCGEEIDSHDVVVRFNRGTVIKSAAQGKRTSILSTSRAQTSAEILERFDPELTMWMTFRWYKIPSWSAEDWTRIEVMPISIWSELRSALGARPTTGMMMIWLLHKHVSPNSVKLYGFDFYQTPNFYRGPQVPHKLHSPDLERKLIERILLENTKFSVKSYNDR